MSQKPEAAENVSASYTWSISEAARRAGVSPGTIRVWEKEGLVKPGRSDGGARRYDATQMRRVERIAYLRNVSKLNIPAIRAALRAEIDCEQSSSEPAKAGSGPTYGEQLRRVRRIRELKLAEVAEGTGLSTSFISALERGQVGAGVDTIQKLLRFYGTTESAMLSTGAADAGRHGTLTRAEDRATVLDTYSKVALEQLLPVQSTLGAALTTVEPGGGSMGSYSHDGHEFIYVMSGKFEMLLEDERYDLVTGDCLFFSSKCPHSWHNSATVPAVLLWVTTPPTY